MKFFFNCGNWFSLGFSNICRDDREHFNLDELLGFVSADDSMKMKKKKISKQETAQRRARLVWWLWIGNSCTYYSVNMRPFCFASSLSQYQIVYWSESSSSILKKKATRQQHKWNTTTTGLSSVLLSSRIEI